MNRSSSSCRVSLKNVMVNGKLSFEYNCAEQTTAYTSASLKVAWNTSVYEIIHRDFNLKIQLRDRIHSENVGLDESLENAHHHQYVLIFKWPQKSFLSVQPAVLFFIYPFDMLRSVMAPYLCKMFPWYMYMRVVQTMQDLWLSIVIHAALVKKNWMFYYIIFKTPFLAFLENYYTDSRRLKT